MIAKFKMICISSLFLYSSILSASCPIDQSSEFVIRGQTSDALLYELNLDNALEWFIETPETEFGQLNLFRSFTRSKVDTEFYYLLNRHIAHWEAILGSDHYLIQKAMLMLNGQIGTLTMTDCLDQLLIDHQFSLVSFSRPSEFVSLIFVKDNKLKILGGSRTNEGFGFDVAISLSEIEKLKLAGWDYYASYHSHPFEFDQLPSGDIGGTVAASLGDEKYFAAHFNLAGMKNMRITNGFYSMNYTYEDFIKLISITP